MHNTASFAAEEGPTVNLITSLSTLVDRMACALGGSCAMGMVMLGKEGGCVSTSKCPESRK